MEPPDLAVTFSTVHKHVHPVGQEVNKRVTTLCTDYLHTIFTHLQPHFQLANFPVLLVSQGKCSNIPFVTSNFCSVCFSSVPRNAILHAITEEFCSGAKILRNKAKI